MHNTHTTDSAGLHRQTLTARANNSTRHEQAKKESSTVEKRQTRRAQTPPLAPRAAALSRAHATPPAMGLWGPCRASVEALRCKCGRRLRAGEVRLPQLLAPATAAPCCRGASLVRTWGTARRLVGSDLRCLALAGSPHGLLLEPAAVHQPPRHAEVEPATSPQIARSLAWPGTRESSLEQVENVLVSVRARSTPQATLKIRVGTAV